MTTGLERERRAMHNNPQGSLPCRSIGHKLLRGSAVRENVFHTVVTTILCSSVFFLVDDSVAGQSAISV